MFTLLRRRCWSRLLLLAGSGVLLAADEPAATLWRMEAPGRIGGVATEVLGAPREVDGGVVFDGAKDGLIVPANPLAGCVAWTVEVFVRPDGDGEVAQRFFHAQENGTEGSRVLLETRVDGKGGWWLDTFVHGPGGERALIDPRRVHAAGKWHWVALRYDGRTLAHFVDGAKEQEGEVTFAPMRDGRVSLGVRQNRKYWFKGAIGAVRFTPAAVAEEKLRRAE